MTTDELKKEAEEWLNKWELCNKCQNKVDCVSNFSYCKKVVLQSYLASAEPREKRIAELEEEVKEWKDEWQEQVQKANDESYARTLQTIQLTKAKDIIKKFLLWENDWHDKTESKYELLKQAEQFIKDSEV